MLATLKLKVDFMLVKGFVAKRIQEHPVYPHIPFVY